MPLMDAGDAFGRLVMALGMAALLAYLVPMAVALPPPWARRIEIVTYGLIGLALLLALGATAAWFLGR